MPQPPDTLGRIDDAIARFDQALASLGQILKTGEQTVTIDGIEHELRELAKRLRALRDDVASKDHQPQ
jgi:hypothetical protein